MKTVRGFLVVDSDTGGLGGHSKFFVNRGEAHAYAEKSLGIGERPPSLKSTPVYVLEVERFSKDEQE